MSMRLCHKPLHIMAVSMRSSLVCQTCQPLVLLSAEKPLSEWFRLKYSAMWPNVSPMKLSSMRSHSNGPVVAFDFGMTYILMPLPKHVVIDLKL